MADFSTNRIEFYKEAYYKEIEIKSGLNNEITLQGTVLTALLSAIFYLATNFQTPYKLIHTTFLLCCLTTIGVIIYGGYHLFRSYYDFLKEGRTYKYLPKMNDIEDHYYTIGENEQRFETYLIGILAQARDNNAEHNKAKTELLTSSSKWMGKAFGCGVISIFLYLLNLIITPHLPTNQRLELTKTPTKHHNERSIGSTSATPRTTTSVTTGPTASSRKASGTGAKIGGLPRKKREP